ncbi:E3 ubiquitin-protein ligase RLIM-like [Tupaia chinensis]|uniref:E3 ubiquitin-protein ligase RLIM-like n=1 Tax=Tupaia chinensis TaxID=246437 RepID=UPI0003C8DAA4|nr:E3 ubiquitin-protein ligase RLIM-like [Tupaia chinensis]
MDSSDSDDDDGEGRFSIYLRRPMDRPPREEGSHPSVTHRSEGETYESEQTRDEESLGAVGGQDTEKPARNVKPDESLSGRGDSSAADTLNPTGQGDDVAGFEQREHQSSTATNQSNLSDIRSSERMRLSPNKGRRNLGNEYASSTTFSREENVQTIHSQMESTLSVSTLARPSTSEQRHTPEEVTEVPSIGTQRRSRMWSPDHRRIRARPGHRSPATSPSGLFQRYYMPPDSLEQSIAAETEISSEIQQHETFRPQLTEPELQSRHPFASSRARGAVPREYSLETARARGNVGLRQRRLTRLVDLQVTVYRGEFVPIDRLASRIQLLSETPDNTVTSESEQESPRNISSDSEQADVRPRNTIRFPSAAQSSSGQMSEFGASSNLMDSDSDFESTVPLLSQDIERARLQSRRNVGTYDDPLLEDPAFNPSSGPLFFGSHSRYMFSSSSNLISSSSSSSENSDSNPVMFEASSEGSLSSRSALEARRESGNRVQIAFGERDAQPAPNPPPFFVVNEPHYYQPIGLTRQQIDSLAVRNFDNTDALKSCSICITEYREGSKLRILPCSHEYHAHCIDRWLSENTTCPICRRRVLESSD